MSINARCLCIVALAVSGTLRCQTLAWVKITPTKSPSARPYHAMAYDSDRDRVVLFGGGVGGKELFDTSTLR